ARHLGAGAEEDRGGRRLCRPDHGEKVTGRVPVFDALVDAFRAPDLRNKILFTLGMLVVFRFLAHVPLPGVDQAQLATVLANNQLLSLLDLFSGGGLARFSVVALGVNPYIN